MKTYLEYPSRFISTEEERSKGFTIVFTDLKRCLTEDKNLEYFKKIPK